MKELVLIENLVNTALEHKATCATPHCNVSLYLLREAAKQLSYALGGKFATEAETLIEKMPLV